MLTEIGYGPRGPRQRGRGAGEAGEREANQRAGAVLRVGGGAVGGRGAATLGRDGDGCGARCLGRAARGAEGEAAAPAPRLQAEAEGQGGRGPPGPGASCVGRSRAGSSRWARGGGGWGRSAALRNRAGLCFPSRPAAVESRHLLDRLNRCVLLLLGGKCPSRGADLAEAAGPVGRLGPGCGGAAGWGEAPPLPSAAGPTLLSGLHL